MDIAARALHADRSVSTFDRPLIRWSKIASISAAILALYATVVVGLARDWWTLPSQSQGLLIPPLACYIAWERRSLLYSREAAPDSRGLLLMGFACCMFLMGQFTAEFFLTRFSLVVLLVALAWTFWGLARLRVLALPFLLLATMVPPPSILYNAVASPLQLMASTTATAVAQAFGVSVFRDGNVIHLAEISLGVEEACSGLHSLSALFVGGILLAFLNCTRPWTRVLVILSSVPISIGMNVFRVSGTAMLADWKQELALGFYHSFSGWFVFLMGFGLLYLTSRQLHRLEGKTL